jgi:uncharacterized protein YbaP (TraB family)
MTFVNRLKSTTGRVGRYAIGAALGVGLIAALVGLPKDALAQAAPTAPAPAAAPAVTPATGDGPAIWVVRDEDSTLYLFGTVHVLKPDTPWGTGKVDAAYAASDNVVFEISNPDDQAAIFPIFQQYGLSPETPLSSRLTPEDLASLTEAAQTIGVPVAQLEPLRPWLAAVQLTVAVISRAGYDPQMGVERVFKARATADAKPISGLETVDEQIRSIATLPDEVQLAMLTESLDQFEEAETLIDDLVEDWSTGDLEGLEQIMVEDMREESEELYQSVIVRRNTAWADRIVTMLEGSGTTFIAVGAGHLVGEDSVQELLEDRGVTVQRH